MSNIITVNPKNLVFPKGDAYVRRGVNDAHVETFEGMMTGKTWPASLGTITVVAKLDKDNKPTGEYVVLDGQHRATAALNIGLTEVPAALYTPKSEREAFEFQVSSNMGRGADLDARPKDRDHAIKVCRTVFKMDLAEIGALFNLNKSSVSRILRDMQASGRKATHTKKGKGKKKGKKVARATESADALKPSDVIPAMRRLAAIIADNVAPIAAHIERRKAKWGEAVNALVAAMSAVDSFTAPEPAPVEPGAGEPAGPVNG